MKEAVKNSLHKPYLEFIEDIKFDVIKFRKDLDEVKHKLNLDLVIYLQGTDNKAYIKEALLKFLSTDYSEELDELFSKHFNLTKKQ